MSGDRAAELAFLLLALSLPASALIARRLSPGTWLRMALLWLVIILATLAAVTLVRHMLAARDAPDGERGSSPSQPISFT